VGAKAVKVRKFTLSDSETERWAKIIEDGENFREVTKRELSVGEPRGTQIQLFDAWGTLLEQWAV
jgi:hypothetical protein